MEERVHASCVSIGGNGVAIFGPSGSGKSDLALRLIDRGATLICDDQSNLLSTGEEIVINAPEEVAGRLEVRSLGILKLNYMRSAPLKLKIVLGDQVERYPMDRQIDDFMGQKIATIKLDATEASAPIKVEMALERVLRTGNLI